MSFRFDGHNHVYTLSRVIEPSRLADTVRSRMRKGAMMGLIDFPDKRYEAFADAAERAEPRAVRISNAVYFPDHDVTVFRGEKVKTQQGHHLVLGLPEDHYLPIGQPIEHVLQEAHDNIGSNVVTTPYAGSSVGDYIRENKELVRFLHAVDVHDGEMLPWLNRSAQELYNWAECEVSMMKTHDDSGPDEYGPIGMLSSSDGHTFREIGSSFTLFEGTGAGSFDHSSGEVFASQLRDLVTTAPRKLVRRYSPIAAGIHAGILISQMAGKKFGVHMPKGDPEALRF